MAFNNKYWANSPNNDRSYFSHGGSYSLATIDPERSARLKQMLLDSGLIVVEGSKRYSPFGPLGHRKGRYKHYEFDGEYGREPKDPTKRLLRMESLMEKFAEVLVGFRRVGCTRCIIHTWPVIREWRMRSPQLVFACLFDKNVHALVNPAKEEAMLQAMRARGRHARTRVGKPKTTWADVDAKEEAEKHLYKGALKNPVD